MTPEQIVAHFVEIGKKPRKAKLGDAGCVLAIRQSPLGFALVFMLVGPDAREVVAAETPDPSWETAGLIVDVDETSNNIKDGCNKVVVVPSKIEFSEPMPSEAILSLDVAVPLTQEQKDILAADAAHAANASAAAVVHHVADAAAEAVKSAVEAALASPAPAPGAVERHH